MENSHSNFQITPETKIHTLLEKYPQLEETLLQMAPEFKKLRNPLLRKTVAKVASLRQVATLGKVSLSEMINKLREEAGIQDKFMADESEVAVSKEKPSWFSSSRIVQSLDIRPILESGEQPIQRVFKECQNLKFGEIYELITPFLPAPLIENAEKQGFLVWSKEESNQVFKTYLTPKREAPVIS